MLTVSPRAPPCATSVAGSASRSVAESCADSAAGNNGVRPGCPDRGPDDPDAVGGEDGVEGPGVLGVAISDEELDAARVVSKLHREVAGLLGHPSGDRLGGDASDPHEPRVVVDEHEHVEPAEENRVDMEEVARDESLRLRGEELCPGSS